MKKRIIACLVATLFLCLAFVLVGCGSTESDGASPAKERYLSNSTDESDIVLTEDRLLVYTVNMTLSVDNLQQTLSTLRQKTTAYGGYEQSSYQNDASYICIVVRIPTEKLNDFLRDAEANGEVNNKSVSCEDITDSYLNAKAQKESYEKELATYTKLLDSATKIEDIIAIQEKMDELSYKIDRAEKQISGYKKEADYSTVTLSLYETSTYVEPNFWDEMSTLFLDSTSSIGTFFRGLFTVLVAITPYVLLLGALFGLYVLIKFIICKICKKPFGLFKRTRKRRAERKQIKEALLKSAQAKNEELPSPSETKE